MKRHQTTGNWKLGLTLSVITCILWSILPVALKVLLSSMDPITITWYRFVVASILIGFFVFKKEGPPKLRIIRGKVLVLMFLACAGVAANYVIYLLGLQWLTPSTAQVVIQTAPIFLIGGGVLVFHESFTKYQMIGVLIFTIGLALFFNQRWDELIIRVTNYTWGVLLILLSGLLWVIYAMSQKQLLQKFSSSTIMFFVYLFGAIGYLAFAKPSAILEASALQHGLLAFCALNTVFAYGCFAEALNHWEASRVSAVLTMVPLLTVGIMHWGAQFFPEYIQSENLNNLSLIGAGLVVVGSVLVALYKQGKRAATSDPA